MPLVYKILGQSAPAATTEADLYTVPASTSTIVSSISIANRGTAIATYRISTSATGSATATKDYVVYDANINPNQTIVLTLGLTLATTDKVRVYGSTADLSFQAFGTQVS